MKDFYFALQSASEDGGALALGLPNVGGVFILLMVGGVAAIIASFFELICDVLSRSRELKVCKIGDEVLYLLKFYLKIQLYSV
jgi:hypothetical protein